MSYSIAVANAEADAQMYPRGTTCIEQDVRNHRVVLRWYGEIVATYRYED